MTKLSVNVNKIATLRNARGKNNPDVLQACKDLIRFGAEGITVHPRPDGRHIRRDDVYKIKAAIDVEFNIEGYPSDDFLEMVEDVRPAQCTLVPDPPEVITSNAGWKVKENEGLLRSTTERLKAKGIRSSVFVDPERMQPSEYEMLNSFGVDRVELFTEAYAESYGHPKQGDVLAKYITAAELARAANLGINAGHDLNLENLNRLATAIPWMAEVSIGHALICDALYMGLEQAVGRYLAAIRRANRA